MSKEIVKLVSHAKQASNPKERRFYLFRAIELVTNEELVKESFGSILEFRSDRDPETRRLIIHFAEKVSKKQSDCKIRKKASHLFRFTSNS